MNVLSRLRTRKWIHSLEDHRKRRSSRCNSWGAPLCTHRDLVVGREEQFESAGLKGLVEAALLVDVMFLLMFIRAAFPILTAFLQVLAPVPVAIVSARHGAKPALLGAVAGWVVASSLFGITCGIWGLFYASVGVVLGKIFRGGGLFWWIVCRVWLSYTLLFALSLAAAAQVLGLGPVALLGSFASVVRSAVQLILESGLVGRSAPLALIEAHPPVAFALAYLLICLMYSLASCSIVSRLLSRLG